MVQTKKTLTLNQLFIVLGRKVTSNCDSEIKVLDLIQSIKLQKWTVLRIYNSPPKIVKLSVTTTNAKQTNSWFKYTVCLHQSHTSIAVQQHRTLYTLKFLHYWDSRHLKSNVCSSTSKEFSPSECIYQNFFFFFSFSTEP